MLVTIVWRPSSLVSERVGIIRISSSTKPNSRVTGIAVVLFITNDTYSGFGKATALTVEPFLVTLGLQGGIGTNQKLPRARPSEVARNCPSAIKEYRELAFLLITMKFNCCRPIFMPRQILEKDVLQ